MTAQPIRTDITIVGGNMVGAALSLALSNSPLNVTLIEQNPIPSLPDSDTHFDIRASALIPAAVQFLKYLDAWDHIPASRKQAFPKMTIWEQQLSNAFHFESPDAEPLGYIVENNLMQYALWQVLKHKSVQCIQTKWRYVEQTDDYVILTLDNGQIIHTKLLIGADGPRSNIRKAAGISASIHSYQQTCIVGSVRTQHTHQNTCWQRYRDGLACAFLPLNEQYSSVAWYVHSDEFNALMSKDTQAQAKQLTVDSGNMLGDIEIHQPLQGFPITNLKVDRWFNHRIVLAGDAAHVIHPMAGQGVNLGYLDAAVLAESLLDAGPHFDHPNALKRYQMRRAETHIMQSAMDAVNTLFQPAPEWISQLRAQALVKSNRFPFVNKYLSLYAKGGLRDLPRSMQAAP